MESNYSWALGAISVAVPDSDIRAIAEVGSRDGLDGMYLARHFGSVVAIFEADPINAETCRKNLSMSPDLDCELFEVALSDRSGTIDFYSIDAGLYDNRGASSLYEVNFKHRPWRDPDRNRASIARKITVQSKRFDEFELPSPDLIAMDVEGAELSVLQGFGSSWRRLKPLFWKRLSGITGNVGVINFLR